MPAGTVAVTFDDGPDPDGTLAVLDRLDELGWPATFFVLGTAAERHADVVAEAARRGHAVAVHGHEHRYLIARTPRAVHADLARGVDAVHRAAGSAPTWWRPPYGVLSGPALIAARARQLRPLLWSAWGKEWRAQATVPDVVAELSRGQLDGGTVLLHDSDATSAPGTWRRTVGALDGLAALLDARGITVAPLPS
jgi:peptidoglycan/xylan/chitin deacetylase (PgdA/CDA1 family)